MRGRAATLLVLALLFGAVVGVDGDTRAAAKRAHRQSNPGQLNIVTINASQVRILDKKSFEMLFELARTLRQRPTAFDGGDARSVAAPDVILLQEMRFSNLEIFKRLLKQRYPFAYEIVGAEDANTKLLVNLDRVTPTGESAVWDDVCISGRTYQWLGLTENATGAPLLIAEVHFSSKYNSTGRSDCLQRNVEFLRTQTDAFPGAVIVGGDFNKRATSGMYECDPDERNEPMPWYQTMVAPPLPALPAYEDAVRTVQRRKDASMENSWTFERASPSETCRGDHSYRRSRIDYLFVRGATVAEAGADHPGWSGGAPGTRHPTNYRYSDHRFVWARVILTDLGRGKRPTATPVAGGNVLLSWETVPEATAYVIYRSERRKPYTRLGNVGAEVTSFADNYAEHGKTYRYSIAPIGASGQGWESIPSWATADARGPRVVSVSPSRGATGVSLKPKVEIRFDERVKRSSVSTSSVRLVRNGSRIATTVRRVAPRVVELVPTRSLRPATTYKVSIVGVTDELGNRARDDSWTFTTARRRR
jgi:endonuclease/exonuclease/phosphatase family metal-dependent hydrolase